MTAIPITLSFDSELLPPGPQGDPGPSGPPGLDGAPGLQGPPGVGIGISVDSFGAVGDGVTDDSAAIQTAATAAKVHGDRLVFSAKPYRFSNVTVEDCFVEGAGIVEQDNTAADGTVFLCTDTANPLFHVKRGASFRGFSVYYPNQVKHGAPIVYPPTLLCDPLSTVTEVMIENVNAINPYIFIRYGDAAKTTAHGRLSIRGSSIYGVYRGIEAYNLLDVLQISDTKFTWGTFNTMCQGDQTLSHWTAANGAAIYADKIDGLQLSNVLIFGPNKALHVAGARSDLWSFSNVLFDAVLYGLVASAEIEASFSACHFYCYQTGNDAAAGSAVLVSSNGPTPSKIRFSGCHFHNSRGNHIDASGSALRSLIVDGCDLGAIGTAQGASGQRFGVVVNCPNAHVSVQGGLIDLGSYPNSTAVAVTNAKTLNLRTTVVGSQFPISITAIQDAAVVAGNITRGTTGAASINLGSGVAAKTVQGVNSFDKP
jgi:hypothetical protein